MEGFIIPRSEMVPLRRRDDRDLLCNPRLISYLITDMFLHDLKTTTVKPDPCMLPSFNPLLFYECMKVL